MSLKSKLEIENFGMFAASIFYTLVGLLCFTVLIIVDFRFVHIGIMGILSLITAYGLFKKRNWSLWVVVALFLHRNHIFSLHSLLHSGERCIHKHKRNRISYFHMGLHDICDSEKTNLGRLSTTFQKMYRNLFTCVCKLLVFSYFYEAFRLCKCCYSP